MKKFLIINPFGIGDVLFSTPIINALRNSFPDSFIGYICNKRSLDLLSINPEVNEIFVFEKDTYRELWKKSKMKSIKEFMLFLNKVKRRKFDLVIDFSLGRHSSFFSWLIGIPERIGFNFKNRGKFLTVKVDIDGYHNKHIVDYYMDLLTILGINPIDRRLMLSISDEDKNWARRFLKDNGIENGLIVGIIPGGGDSWGKEAYYKHWPEKNFAIVADILVEQYGAKIILLGGKSDTTICNQISKLMKCKSTIACGRTELRKSASLIRLCSMVICNDGGPLHIAVSQGVKTVSLFGPVDENVYGPYPPTENHIIVTKDIECRPCYRKFRIPECKTQDCLRSINSADVLNAVNILIGCKSYERI